MPSPARVSSVARKLVVPLLLLLLWQLVVEVGIYSRSQLPAPVDVVAAVRELHERDRLFLNIGASAQRVAFGFAWGAAIALVLGLAVGVSRSVEDLVSPTFQAIRAVPSLAWVPLLILWMGIGEEPKITLVAIGAFFPIYTNLVAGIRQIDRKLVEVGRAYGMRGLTLVRGVMLPASLPSLFTGLRLGLAQALAFSGGGGADRLLPRVGLPADRFREHEPGRHHGAEHYPAGSARQDDRLAVANR